MHLRESKPMNELDNVDIKYIITFILFVYNNGQSGSFLLSCCQLYFRKQLQFIF